MVEDKPHILIVDDDDRLRTLLKKFLSEQGYLVTTAFDAPDARNKLSRFLFDLMVLDVMMPGETGLSLLKSLAKEKHMPVLMLSAMGEAEDRIRGLEIGAEDYLAKPFEPQELILRIKTILRRHQVTKESTKTVVFGNYMFDTTTNRLLQNGESIPLTTNEAVLLRTLAEAAGQPVSREELAQRMPGSGSERSVDVQITRLRRKIEGADGRPVHLQTVRGAGYVLYGKSL